MESFALAWRTMLSDMIAGNLIYAHAVEESKQPRILNTKI
jgi:hypothetical protein